VFGLLSALACLDEKKRGKERNRRRPTTWSGENRRKNRAEALARTDSPKGKRRGREREGPEDHVITSKIARYVNRVDS